MKKLFFVLISSLILTGCSIDNDTEKVNFELAGITGNDLPEEFIFGKTYEVNVNYKLPTTCHAFAGIDAKRSGSDNEKRRQIYVAAISQVKASSSCDPTSEGNTGTSKFSILIDDDEDYTFYFWVGVNSADEPEYETITIPVKETETVQN
ncbi:membrane lipoprotein lipid attachment site-containing protein [Christiangramia salexigens]|uniref:Lipoprotein n=1 Tax=Christiangramia salexigens TaxID=1913577 RepID=A0A1L3J6T9_9FLAO|nr:membrane lipoprotein lipid attachment site-containing protein [Christiangramia salexigens]APG60846.1 hypothetical protein LPB144_10705 [Christiangramia salexigens]